MRNRYIGLFVIALVLALALSMMRRPAGHPATPPLESRAMAPVSLRIEVRNGRISPAIATVPKDRRVALQVSNRGARATLLSLAGYEDRVPDDSIPAGGSRVVEFLADRPGEDFAWLVDGQPVGRLIVAGSHLEEHRR